MLNVMLVFMCTTSVELRVTRSKRKVQNETFLVHIGIWTNAGTALSIWGHSFIHTTKYELLLIRFLNCTKYVYLQVTWIYIGSTGHVSTVSSWISVNDLQIFVFQKNCYYSEHHVQSPYCRGEFSNTGFENLLYLGS